MIYATAVDYISAIFNTLKKITASEFNAKIFKLDFKNFDLLIETIVFTSLREEIISFSDVVLLDLVGCKIKLNLIEIN